MRWKGVSRGNRVAGGGWEVSIFVYVAGLAEKGRRIKKY